ncbi:MAG: 6-phosphogluconolactonase [Defluviitaleaceae bacterium]|nr:6-phosphogluconolactonase [Defluviitaleaceae bacterium]
MDIRVYKKENLAKEAAEFFYSNIIEVLSKKDICYIGLSGGSTPKEMLTILATEYYKKIPWEKLKIFIVDERTEAPFNYTMIEEALDREVIRWHSGFFIDLTNDYTEKPEYDDLINVVMEYSNSLPDNLDIISLGMGEDGHTASLFPKDLYAKPGDNYYNSNEDYINNAGENSRNTLIVGVPKLETFRLSLSAWYINKADKIFFLISGANKADILKQVLYGDHVPTHLPTQLINLEKSTFLLDEEASSKL